MKSIVINVELCATTYFLKWWSSNKQICAKLNVVNSTKIEKFYNFHINVLFIFPFSYFAQMNGQQF